MMGAARARKLTEYEEESCRREGGWGGGDMAKRVVHVVRHTLAFGPKYRPCGWQPDFR